MIHNDIIDEITDSILLNYNKLFIEFWEYIFISDSLVSCIP